MSRNQYIKLNNGDNVNSLKSKFRIGYNYFLDNNGKVTEYNVIPLLNKENKVGELYSENDALILTNASLPENIKPVLKLINTGGHAVIDTGIIANTSTTKFDVTISTNVYPRAYCPIINNEVGCRFGIIWGLAEEKVFGAWIGAAGDDGISPTGNRVWAYSKVKADSTYLNRRVNLVLSKDGFFVDGKKYDFITPTQPIENHTASFTTLINGRYLSEGNISADTFFGEYHNIKIYQNNVLVRNFIPAVITENNTTKAGMFDLVNQKMYTSITPHQFVTSY